ncbi:hypothetical protein PCASD_11786 [Puccinia coronata f. sp. avenae]|uniref:RRM domain-containing protein n=1 Tax=Puccinia coronata f. sp. avenae TaxID=200324 RepID=A0A2N5UKE3_9BASI|nr:hypothetical protein PCASD_11786 [Puccinia coronata f. sp. avenae]
MDWLVSPILDEEKLFCPTHFFLLISRMAIPKVNRRKISENHDKDAAKVASKKNNTPKHVKFTEKTPKAHPKRKEQSAHKLNGFEGSETGDGSSEEEEEEGEDEDEEDEDEEDGDDSSEKGSNKSSDDASNAQPSSKDQPTPNRKSKRKATDDETGVVYLGRIPHGFYEEEMKSYFSQFGEVLRVRLSRCKRTGKPKHYGFIEFKHRQVAQIVAETIHNYLLSGKLLQCKLLEKDEIHPELWVGAGTKFMKDCKIRLDRQKHNQPKPLSQQIVISNRVVEKEQKKRQRLAEQGIDYDFQGYIPLAQPQAATTATPDDNPRKNKKSKKKA